MITITTPLKLQFTTVAAEIARIAEGLTPQGQQALLDYALLLAGEAQESADSETQISSESQSGLTSTNVAQKNGPGGYIEIKIIKGHPYAYRRWREGKHLRSQYIGKVKSEA